MGTLPPKRREKIVCSVEKAQSKGCFSVGWDDMHISGITPFVMEIRKQGFPAYAVKTNQWYGKDYYEVYSTPQYTKWRKINALNAKLDQIQKDEQYAFNEFKRAMIESEQLKNAYQKELDELKR